MKYVMIENNGEASITGLMILGATTARGDNNKIGQFGQGFLGSITMLLREKIDFKIFIGNKEVKFETDTQILANKVIDVIYYTFDGNRYCTNICLDYCAIDWNDPCMAMREFISNALDQDKEVCKMTLTERPEGKNNTTRVFVEFNNTIREYVENINKYFLHFTNSEDKTLIKNTESRGPRIYRRGVLVGELKMSKNPSLYDYNFHDMPIDECRNIDIGVAQARIAEEISSNEKLFVEIIELVIQKQECYEYERISAFDFDERIVSFWKKNFPSLLICGSSNQYNFAIKNGQNPIIIENWYSGLKYHGIQHVDFKPLDIEEAGMTVVEPTELLKSNFDKVWNRLVKINASKGKNPPKLKMFEGLDSAGTHLAGEYRDGVVYINKANQTSFSTIVEEIAHYISTGSDYSSTLQSYLCDIAGRMIEE